MSEADTQNGNKQTPGGDTHSSLGKMYENFARKVQGTQGASAIREFAELLNTRPTRSVALPREQVAAFFRWESQGEPVAIHFHLNVVDRLERMAAQAQGQTMAGVLLGRTEPGRQLALIVEDYVPLPARNDPLASPFGDHTALEEMLERWRPGQERRMSVLGFYRRCVQGDAAINDDDLSVLRTDHILQPANTAPEDSQRLFLLIEPLSMRATNAALFAAQSGKIIWQWPSVIFNRIVLSAKNALSEPPAFTHKEPPFRIENIAVNEDFDPPSSERWTMGARNLRWLLACLIGVIALSAGMLRWSGAQTTTVSAVDPEAPQPSPLGLKLQHNGSAWRVSWDRNAPILAEAVGGNLLITDGKIHKLLNLDPNELRNGSVLYQPATDDVSLRLEVLAAEPIGTMTESVRIVNDLMSSSNRSQDAGAAAVSGDSEEPASSASSPILNANAVRSSGARPESNPRPRSQNRPSYAGVAPQNSQPMIFSVDPASSLRSVTEDTHVAGPTVKPLIKSEITAPNQPVAALASPVRESPQVDEHAEPAQVIAQKTPLYPDEARAVHASGAVELHFHIAVNGRVRDVSVVKGNPLLAQAAMDAIAEWRYKPAEINGTPVESEGDTIFTFRLE